MPSEKSVCVYTVMIGNYEALNEQPAALRSDIPFICLTDDPSLTSKTWQIIELAPAFKMDPVRSQRVLKICPHLVGALDGFDRSLYIDNSVVLHDTPEQVIRHYGWAQGIGLPTHSFRESVMDEFIEVARVGYDDQSRIFEQLNHYLAYGEPTLSERPYWTAIMLRDHRDERVRAAMLRWAEHVLRYSRRDQLSLNAALRDAGVAPVRWELDNHESWFHSWPHAHQRDRLGGGRDAATSMTPPLAQVRQLQLAIDVARSNTESLASELAAMRASASWRVTSPLRRLKQWVRHAAEATPRPANSGAEIGAMHGESASPNI